MQGHNRLQGGLAEGILISERGGAERRRQAAEAEKWRGRRRMIGKTVKLKMQQASLYVTANFDEDDKMQEVFVNDGQHRQPGEELHRGDRQAHKQVPAAQRQT